MLDLRALPPTMRRNLAFELAYSATAGVVSGLAYLAPVAVLGSLGGGALEVTLLTAAMPAAALLQPAWAALARRFRLKHLAMASAASRCLPLFLIGTVWHPAAFTALIVAYHLLGGPVTLAVPSLYKYTYADSHRGRIIGLLRMTQHFVAIPIMLGGAALLDFRADWYRLLYPVGGVIGLGGLLFYGRLRIRRDCPLRRVERSEAPTWSNLLTIVRQDRNFRLFQATIFLTGTGFLVSRSIWIYLLRDIFALGQLEIIALVQVMPIILGALTAPGWGWLIDRTSPVAGRVAFALLGSIAYLAIFASFAGHWLVLAVVGALLRGGVLGAAEVATTTGNLYFSVHAERAALYESISSVFRGIRGLTMPLLGLALFSQVHFLVFLAPVLLNLWSLRLALRLWHRDRREPPELAWRRRTAADSPDPVPVMVEVDGNAVASARVVGDSVVTSPGHSRCRRRGGACE